MAQQTQAARAAEAWSRFIADYPTPAALGPANPAAVLRAWRGLGYNRRALALQRAAQAIVRDHDGHVPQGLEALLRLPGVGPYTARAVAALAFGRRVGAVDTNVRRVLSRAFFHGWPARATQALADDLAPPRRGLWTHAVSGHRATPHRARAPRCEPCPLKTSCATRPTDRGRATAKRGRHRHHPDGSGHVAMAPRPILIGFATSPTGGCRSARPSVSTTPPPSRSGWKGWRDGHRAPGRRGRRLGSSRPAV
jgi:A/G-specific adenine glycosylase